MKTLKFALNVPDDVSFEDAQTVLLQGLEICAGQLVAVAEFLSRAYGPQEELSDGRKQYLVADLTDGRRQYLIARLLHTQIAAAKEPMLEELIVTTEQRADVKRRLRLLLAQLQSVEDRQALIAELLTES